MLIKCRLLTQTFKKNFVRSRLVHPVTNWYKNLLVTREACFVCWRLKEAFASLLPVYWRLWWQQRFSQKSVAYSRNYNKQVHCDVATKSFKLHFSISNYNIKQLIVTLRRKVSNYTWVYQITIRQAALLWTPATVST